MSQSVEELQSQLEAEMLAAVADEPDLATYRDDSDQPDLVLMELSRSR